LVNKGESSRHHQKTKIVFFIGNFGNFGNHNKNNELTPEKVTKKLPGYQNSEKTHFKTKKELTLRTKLQVALKHKIPP
jgi:hypothetical protein